MNLFQTHANKVLVVGDVMLDKYLYGSTERISPEAPVPIVKIKSDDARAGGAANVGLNLSALKVQAEVAGIVGRDSEGSVLADLLHSAKVSARFVISQDKPTITKLRIMSRHQQLLRLDQEELFSDQDAAALAEKALAESDAVTVAVLSDYAKGSLGAIRSLIDGFNQRDIPILVDPKGTDFSRYRGATLLTPNMSEFEAVVGHCASEDIVVQKAMALLAELDLKALLVTRSEKGMTLFQPDKDPVYFAANAKAVFDVTGAGDTVIATLAAGFAAGLNLERAVEIANIAAGIAVSKLGTDTVSLAELNAELAHYSESDEQKVVSESALVQALVAARQRNEKIVFTNGCFDILHPGHVSYLAQAKKLGDKLIVAVNSDASVSRLKGPSRPINHLEHRMHVLGGLASVDWVVPFEEDTPARIIAELVPDVLVKGGDYKLEDIVGADTVLNAGGEVKVLNFEDGFSTTGIIEAAHQSSLKQ